MNFYEKILNNIEANLNQNFDNIECSDDYNDDEFSEIYNLYITCNDIYLFEIIITVRYEEIDGEEFRYNTNVISEIYEIFISEVLYNSIGLNDKEIRDDYEKFIKLVNEYILKIKNFEYDVINNNKDIEYYLKIFPIFNKEKYNTFVEKVLNKDTTFFKYVKYDELYKHLKTKYKYLHNAKNFDLL